MKRFEKALKLCSQVLQIQENNGEALANRADAYLSMDEFEKAKHDFKKAHDNDNQNQRVRSFHSSRFLIIIS
jgi:tetratricopeptide (TPR) repeat protein